MPRASAARSPADLAEATDPVASPVRSPGASFCHSHIDGFTHMSAPRTLYDKIFDDHVVDRQD
ncbi:MAG: hypothetical protein E5Y00_00780, partial [Mesorhizobium sp.]